jgi:hypothetical protein
MRPTLVALLISDDAMHLCISITRSLYFYWPSGWKVSIRATYPGPMIMQRFGAILHAKLGREGAIRLSVRLPCGGYAEIANLSKL